MNKVTLTSLQSLIKLQLINNMIIVEGNFSIFQPILSANQGLNHLWSQRTSKRIYNTTSCAKSRFRSHSASRYHKDILGNFCQNWKFPSIVSPPFQYFEFRIANKYLSTSFLISTTSFYFLICKKAATLSDNILLPFPFSITTLDFQTPSLIVTAEWFSS